MVSILFFCTMLISMVPVGCGSKSGDGPKRLAVIGFTSGAADPKTAEECATLVDLLTAQLSTNNRLDLVERVDIEALLREQSLSLAQASELKEAVRTGRILRADWLVMGKVLTNLTEKTLLAKIVDARTGVIRNVSFLPAGKEGLTPLVGSLASFVQDTMEARPEAKRRTYLAVGNFENVSLVQRYPDFGKNLQMHLSTRFVGEDYAVVERSMIMPFLDELQLGMVGLGEEDDTATAAQPAFVLVDGIFQAYQDEESKLNLVMRVERLGDHVQRFSFNEPVSEALYAKIREVLQTVMDEPVRKRISRLEEAQAQMQRGIELARIRKGSDGRYEARPRMSDSPAAGDTKKTVLEEATKAFASALFLDPANEECKLFLALCYLHEDLDRPAEGISYLHEIASSSTNRSLVVQAREELGRYHRERNPARARLIYEALWEEAENARDRVRYLPYLGPVVADEARGNITLEQKLAWKLKRWRTEMQAELEHRRAGGRGGIRVPGSHSQGMMEYVDLFGGDTAAVKVHLDGIMPQLELEFPEWKPYLTMGYVQLFGSNIPPDVLENYLRSLDWCDRHPDEIAYPKDYFNPGLASAISHHFWHGNYDLLLRAMAVLVRHGQVTDELHFYKGWVHRLRGDLDSAIESFKKIGQRQVRPPLIGPWGYLGSIPGDLMVKQCVVLKGARIPVRNELPSEQIGSPELSFNSPFLFKSDGPRVWVLHESVLHEYAQGKLHPVSVTVSNRPIRDLHTFVVGERDLWLGTQGEGLIALNKETGRSRQYTLEAGLLQNSIHSLYALPDKIWIGFGDASKDLSMGGFGFLDLSTDRFIGIMGELDPNLTQRPIGGARDPELTSKDAPARRVISAFAQRDPGELLAMAYGNDGRIFRYRLDSKTWTTAHSLPQFYCFSANEHWLAAGLLMVDKPENDPSLGPLSVYDETNKKWKGFGQAEGLLKHAVRAIALDGNRVWVGGYGYLACVNLDEAKVERLLKLRELNFVVEEIAFNGDELWFGAQARGAFMMNQSRLYKLSL